MLIWKLLRQHISIAQLMGFALSNLLGMLIVLASIQFYRDVKPIFSGEDSFLPENYIVVSKPVSTLGGLLGIGSNTFSKKEISDLQAQPFTLSAGAFTASKYDVRASVGMGGMGMSTDLFFEAVPDEFVDIKHNDWHFSNDPSSDDYSFSQQEVPIILPRNYLSIYNFGFAQSKGLPKMSETAISSITINLRLRGNGHEEYMRGRVVGFGKRLNTVLVPQSFIEWSNNRYAPDSNHQPSRLILKVSNTADDRIVAYMNSHSYDVEDDKAEQGRITFMLRVISGVIICVGLLISVLSFFILMLSIYLLVQKNTQKLQNLLLIGYPVWRVALPYQMLTVATNILVAVLALCGLHLLRNAYMARLSDMFPTMSALSLWVTYTLCAILFLIVSALNIVIIRRKINSLF